MAGFILTSSGDTKERLGTDQLKLWQETPQFKDQRDVHCNKATGDEVINDSYFSIPELSVDESLKLEETSALRPYALDIQVSRQTTPIHKEQPHSRRQSTEKPP